MRRESRSNADATSNSRLRGIPLEQIRANPKQPRTRFEKASLLTLADSTS
jgi:ParB-like chromosome segregation protein Spo0J